jgi:two-component system LytT family response regulator
MTASPYLLRQEDTLEQPAPRLRAIVVDDEPDGREYLEELLADEPSIELIGSYDDPRLAMEAVLRDKPDLLFLDLQKPGLDGAEVLECIRTGARIAAAAGTRRTTVIERRAGPFIRHLAVRVGERIVLPRVSDVSWFEADGKYIHLHIGNERLMLRHTMQSLEGRLNPELFVRVSRSAIVNVDHIRHLEPWSQGDYVITLKNGGKVHTTQAFRATLRRLVRPA